MVEKLEIILFIELGCMVGILTALAILFLDDFIAFIKKKFK